MSAPSLTSTIQVFSVGVYGLDETSQATEHERGESSRCWEPIAYIGDGQYFQLIQICKHRLAFISLHSIPGQTFPVDVHEPDKWKRSTKRDAFLRKANREHVCFTEIQVQPGNSHLGPSTSGIFTKPMGRPWTALKTALNFHHQPPTSCFANACVLQHVPVADYGSWLHILRTK